MERDFYSVLGIPSSASQKEIKKAYKKLAAKFHPDVNKDPDTVARYKEINRAYETLSDIRKRQGYDTMKNLGVNQFRTDSFINNFIYNFSNRRATQRTQRVWNSDSAELNEPGEDIEVHLSITLEEAASGCSKEVKTVSGRKYPCNVCGGIRAQPGTKKMLCFACSGQGKTLSFGRDGNRVVKCPACKGHGDKPLFPCITCKGTGRIRQEKMIKVQIPVGVDSETKLRLTGMGTPGVNMPAGDLYINIHVLPHDKLRRKGQDLYIEHPISLKEAIEGGKTKVTTLDGLTIQIDVPPGVQPGKTVSIVRGAGIKNVKGDGKGDLYVQFFVNLPKIKTARAHKLLEELEVELSRND